MRKFINEIIGQEYQQWLKGDLILITSGTGTGKSTFIQNILNDFCIKTKSNILYLTNRDILKEQIKTNLTKINTITVLNYQKIEAYILNNIRLDNYDYIVMDEAHYFFTDSSFNMKTNLFFNKMINDNSICKIMMTATPKILLFHMKQHNIKINYTYKLKTDYNYLNEIIAFNDYESMDSIIKDIPQDEQIILFTTAKKALEVSKKYKGAFLCSKHNEQYYNKYVKNTDNEIELQNIIENGYFNNHLLCTTTALDNGINIKENTPIKHIIIDILDKDIFIQCLGRKRVAEGEKINLYFYSYNDNKRINGFKRKIMNALDRADYLTKYGQVQYIQHKFKNEKFTDTRIIDDILIDNDGHIQKVINECIYTKYYTDMLMYNTLLSKQITFKHIISIALDIEQEEIKEMKTSEIIKPLEEVLEGLTGQKLYKEQQKELINFIGLKDARGRIQKSIGQFNAYFTENKLNYMITVPKRKSYKNEEGKVQKEKTYWIIIKI